jgi:hypothetical protein
MTEESSDPRVPAHLCSNWKEIVECLDGFPPPRKSIDPEGDVVGTEWVFRGLQDSTYKLHTTIERAAESKLMSWSALECLVESEFRSRARMYLEGPSIPGDEDDLAWLALMQHHGAPTRLLDFTYSPYVALYFAVRHIDRPTGRSHVRVWAIDAQAVNAQFRRVFQVADIDDRTDRGENISHRVSFRQDYAATESDNMRAEIHGFRTLIARSLKAKGVLRGELQRRGCVCAASPTTFNPRLASQQGVSLINLAENVGFGESLTTMMARLDPGWCKVFDIAGEAIPEIEEQLYRRNIHEQSLFPDVEGLAGLIRQKIRLQWA